jgi:RecQ family ATP-dependent DNA helicase
MLWTDKAQKYLDKYWKIAELKDKQFEVINELLLGNDVVGLLPTGYGKSMCYLIPPLVTRKVIFIISPLISLMDDQKDKLVKMNIPCGALHGNNKNKDQEVFDIIDGKIKIVYMSPEYLVKSDGLELAEQLIMDNKLGFLAIDESHCISVWGQDFRPEYTKIKLFREMFPQIPILAVTATATPTVCGDICKNLCLKNPTLVRASFDRPNLYLKICEVPHEHYIDKNKIKSRSIPKEQLVWSYIKKYPNDKIIIYTNSRKDAEELSEQLNKTKKNISQAYHAGLSKGIREKIQTDFTDGIVKVIVSTIAFGMGIDLIVKCVLIFGCPSSIEEYYQQIGRGGRDGKPCETVLYFDYSNLVIAKHMIRDLQKRYPSLYKSKIENLNKISNLVYLQTCRRKFILEYFNESCDFLVDMTDKFWSIIMKPNTTILGMVNEIRNKFLTPFNMKDKKGDDKQVDLDLMGPVWKWKTFVLENKIKKDELPDKLKLKIPNKFISSVDTKVNGNLIEPEDPYKKYEKYLDL